MSSSRTTTASAPTPAGVSPTEGRKIVPVCLSHGNDGSLIQPAQGSCRLAVNLGVTVHRWRLVIAHRNSRQDVPAPGSDAVITTVTFGPGTTDAPATGNPEFTDSPTIMGRDIALGAGGDPVALPWQDATLSAGTTYLIGADYHAAAGPLGMNAAGWFSPDATATSKHMSSAHQTDAVPFDWWLDVEVDAATPTVAVWGDSLSSGYAATAPCFDSWPAVLGRRAHLLPIQFTASGDTATDWARDVSAYKWTRWPGCTADLLIVSMASNDLGQLIDRATFEDAIGVCVAQMKTMLGVRRVIATTITPRNDFSPQQDADRRAHNEWLRQQDIFDAVVDVASVMDAGDGTIRPEVNADGVHFTTAGYADMAAAIAEHPAIVALTEGR